MSEEGLERLPSDVGDLRRKLTDKVESVRTDTDFLDRAAGLLERDREILDRLGDQPREN
jgi:hypothetical protein